MEAKFERTEKNMQNFRATNTVQHFTSLVGIEDILWWRLSELITPDGNVESMDREECIYINDTISQHINEHIDQCNKGNALSNAAASNKVDSNFERTTPNNFQQTPNNIIIKILQGDRQPKAAGNTITDMPIKPKITKFNNNVPEEQFNTEPFRLPPNLVVEQFRCCECDEHFGNNISFAVHMNEWHKEDKPFKCKHCDWSFKRYDQLKNHMRTHSGEKPHRCNQCEKHFTRNSDLLRHLRNIHGVTDEKILKQFKYNNNVPNHANQDTTNPSGGGGVLGEPGGGGIPMISPNQPEEVKKLYQCSQCDEQFPYSIDLYRHERTHSTAKSYQCMECPQVFQQCDAFIRHMRVHSNKGEKPYRCTQCDKSYGHNSHLTRHMKVHTG